MGWLPTTEAPAPRQQNLPSSNTARRWHGGGPPWQATSRRRGGGGCSRRGGRTGPKGWQLGHRGVRTGNLNGLGRQTQRSLPLCQRHPPLQIAHIQGDIRPRRRQPGGSLQQRKRLRVVPFGHLRHRQVVQCNWIERIQLWRHGAASTRRKPQGQRLHCALGQTRRHKLVRRKCFVSTSANGQQNTKARHPHSQKALNHLSSPLSMHAVEIQPPRERGQSGT